MHMQVNLWSEHLRQLWLTLLFASVSIPSALVKADIAGHQPWSENVFQHINQTYGPAAEKRMHLLEAFVVKNYNAPIMQKLESTNSALNQLPWIADEDKYHTQDYWATPLETIATFGGDCEDIAISKLMLLRHMGVPAENLRLAGVKLKSTGEAHMVLLYLDKPHLPLTQSRPYVLDNFVNGVRPGSERKDLVAVYVIDANNTVNFIEDDGHHRTVKAEVKRAKFAKLDKIREQIVANQEYYRRLNNGRPLF